jgi:hypothetical protein
VNSKSLADTAVHRHPPCLFRPSSPRHCISHKRRDKQEPPRPPLAGDPFLSTGQQTGRPIETLEKLRVLLLWSGKRRSASDTPAGISQTEPASKFGAAAAAAPRKAAPPSPVHLHLRFRSRCLSLSPAEQNHHHQETCSNCTVVARSASPLPPSTVVGFCTQFSASGSLRLANLVAHPICTRQRLRQIF